MRKFSVVIPLYNKANYIKKTIESVLNQSYNEFEIIVIDDGSTDNSSQVVNGINDLRLHLFQQENKGASHARNKGVELSKNDWIAFLDADDIWYKNHLEELNHSIDSFPEAKVVSNGYEIALDKKFIKKPCYSKTLPKSADLIDDYFSFSLIDPLFWTSSIAVHKDAFKAIGGFDEDISSGQDTDLICRLALKYKLAYNPKVTFLHFKNTENNLSKTNYLNPRLKIIEKLKPEENDQHFLKKYLDVNRFSLALQAKLRHQPETFKKLINEIDKSNLNSKQKFLLNCPAWVLKLMKNIQNKLVKIGIYKSAFT